jgi:hypothetical protein
MIDIAVVIMTLLDHDSLVAIAMLADDFTVAIAIAIPVMTVADGDTDAARADANADFLSTRRHRQRNPSYRDGSHQKTLDHRMFLSMKLSGKQVAGT